MLNDGYYSDMFKSVHANSVALTLNELCAGGQIHLLTASGDILGYWYMSGDEFRAYQYGSSWQVEAYPQAPTRFVSEGLSSRIEAYSRDEVLIFSFPSDDMYFSDGLDFAAIIKIFF